MRGDGFHEWPLAAFSTLATTGAGLLTTPLAAAVMAPAGTAATPVLLPGAALLAAGLAVSLAHLGQPARAPLALARVGRSRISTEIALAGATLIAAVAAIALPDRAPLLALLPAVFATAFLLALGWVYSLAGQVAWRGAVVISPLTMGLGFGTLGLAAARDGALSAVALAGAAILAADTVVFLLRRQKLARLGGGVTPSHPAWFARRGPLLSARFALVDVLPVCLAMAGFPKGAAGFLGLGILLDRLAFYLLSAQQTTEAEIASVEDAISAGQD